MPTAGTDTQLSFEREPLEGQIEPPQIQPEKDKQGSRLPSNFQDEVVGHADHSMEATKLDYPGDQRPECVEEPPAQMNSLETNVDSTARSVSGQEESEKQAPNQMTQVSHSEAPSSAAETFEYSEKRFQSRSFSHEEKTACEYNQEMPSFSRTGGDAASNSSSLLRNSTRFLPNLKVAKREDMRRVRPRRGTLTSLYEYKALEKITQIREEAEEDHNQRVRQRIREFKGELLEALKAGERLPPSSSSRLLKRLNDSRFHTPKADRYPSTKRAVSQNILRKEKLFSSESYAYELSRLQLLPKDMYGFPLDNPDLYIAHLSDLLLEIQHQSTMFFSFLCPSVSSLQPSASPRQLRDLPLANRTTIRELCHTHGIPPNYRSEVLLQPPVYHECLPVYSSIPTLGMTNTMSLIPSKKPLFPVLSVTIHLFFKSSGLYF